VDIPEKEFPEGSLLSRLRVMAVVLVILWIIVFNIWHLGMAIKTAIAGPKIQSATVSLGWPVTKVATRSATARADTGVSPGGKQPGSITPVGVQGSGEKSEDPGIDIHCEWAGGAKIVL